MYRLHGRESGSPRKASETNSAYCADLHVRRGWSHARVWCDCLAPGERESGVESENSYVGEGYEAAETKAAVPVARGRGGVRSRGGENPAGGGIGGEMSRGSECV
eukprot:5223267-Pleurochrysis_carterae.AAC.1